MSVYVCPINGANAVFEVWIALLSLKDLVGYKIYSLRLFHDLGVEEDEGSKDTVESSAAVSKARVEMVGRT
jgi:hypothetical protein